MKKLPRVINAEEFEKLLAEANKSKLKNKKKYMVAMVLGFEAGMRISEILGWKDRVPALTPDRVEGPAIRIISGKGKKDRIVPKPKRINFAAIDMLPLGIQRRALQHFVTRLGEKVLNKKISFHTLRHGAATNFLRKGFELHEVQAVLGHSRLDTTGVYLHADPRTIIKKYQERF